MSYLDYTEKNRREGIAFVELVSNKFKEMGNPDRPLTYEEKQIAQKQLAETHDFMVHDIAENRRLPLEQIKLFADGLTVNGVKAKELGLIDHVGTRFDAFGWLKEKIERDAVLCE